jgi:hypothetical protein
VQTVAGQRATYGETAGPVGWFVVNGIRYGVYMTSITTMHAFHVLVWRAAFAIQKLFERSNNGHVLVHCYAGVNRSAACIVAYLMLIEHLSYDDAVNAVEVANRRRGMKVRFFCSELL